MRVTEDNGVDSWYLHGNLVDGVLKPGFAAIGFVLTVALSWAVTAALRKIPGATRVL